VGAEEGQRLARIEAHAIGRGNEVRRFGVFLELVAKPRVGGIPLEEALDVRQGADLVRTASIENLAVSLGGQVSRRGGLPRVRHLLVQSRPPSPWSFARSRRGNVRS